MYLELSLTLNVLLIFFILFNYIRNKRIEYRIFNRDNIPYNEAIQLNSNSVRMRSTRARSP